LMLARSFTRATVVAARGRAVSAVSASPSALARAGGAWSRTLSSAGSSSSSSEPKPEAASESKEEAPAAEPESSTAEAAGSAEGGEAAEVDPVTELTAKVEELAAQVESKHDQLLRALAEADNARRRAKIDVENAHKFAVGKFAKALVDVADNLGRAAECVPEEMRSSDDQPVLKALYNGVVMTETVLQKTFEEHGLKRVWPIDEKFDPNLHNALFEMPDPSKEPGTIAHVASAGYVLHERCIRAAGVGIVSKPS